MNLDLVITQIKAFAPVFNGNVAGAAAYADGLDNQAWLPAPAAYVVPLSEDAEANQDQGGSVYQPVTERVQIIVQLDNSADRRGQGSTLAYETLKYALLGALLNWRPNSSVDNPGLVDPLSPWADRANRGLYLVSGELIDLNRARLFYAWTFGFETVISDADGWQRPSVPLVEIDIATPDQTITVPLARQ